MNKDLAVRAMAYKALHSAAARTSAVWRDLIWLTRNETDPAVKRAGVWGLFEASNQHEVRDFLMSLAFDARQERDLRLEAVKSLYRAMAYSETRRPMIALGFNEREDETLRVAAILSLSAIAGTEVSRAIEGHLRNPDPEIRSAAIKAAGGGNQPEILNFFHLGTKVDDRHISPIENE
ncbi:MAG: hypothetical protein HY748_17535 [Elusimicrobia bacterium]|nr:hypothetical protein [Elusimicrobiota bacterium]